MPGSRSGPRTRADPVNRPDGSVEGSDPAVFFLSDYGMADEFVGVVHAVLHRLAPVVPVIDLVPSGPGLRHRGGGGPAGPVRGPTSDPGWCWPWSTRAWAPTAGAWPSKCPPTDRPWLVGPDNGLLVPPRRGLGEVPGRAVALGPGAPGGARPERSRPRTFDGRDVFAPAAAHLVSAAPPSGSARRRRSGHRW